MQWIDTWIAELRNQFQWANMSKVINSTSTSITEVLTHDYRRGLLKMFVEQQQGNRVIKQTSNNEEIYV